MNTNTATVRIGCNTNLPTNAVDVVAVVPGMHIRAAFSGEQGVVESVSGVFGNRRRITFTTGATIWASYYGTFRLVDVPEGYNYHNGCCDKS